MIKLSKKDLTAVLYKQHSTITSRYGSMHLLLINIFSPSGSVKNTGCRIVRKEVHNQYGINPYYRIVTWSDNNGCRSRKERRASYGKCSFQRIRNEPEAL